MNHLVFILIGTVYNSWDFRPSCHIGSDTAYLPTQTSLQRSIVAKKENCGGTGGGVEALSPLKKLHSLIPSWKVSRYIYTFSHEYENLEGSRRIQNKIRKSTQKMIQISYIDLVECGEGVLFNLNRYNSAVKSVEIHLHIFTWTKEL